MAWKVFGFGGGNTPVSGNDVAEVAGDALPLRSPCGCAWPSEVEAYFHENQAEGHYYWRRFDHKRGDGEKFARDHDTGHQGTR